MVPPIELSLPSRPSLPPSFSLCLPPPTSHQLCRFKWQAPKHCIQSITSPEPVKDQSHSIITTQQTVSLKEERRKGRAREREKESENDKEPEQQMKCRRPSPKLTNCLYFQSWLHLGALCVCFNHGAPVADEAAAAV